MAILNDIIDWVENKPVFWQVAIDRLIRNNELTDKDVLELKEICKAEYGLQENINVLFGSIKGIAGNELSTSAILELPDSTIDE